MSISVEKKPVFFCCFLCCFFFFGCFDPPVPERSTKNPHDKVKTALKNLDVQHMEEKAAKDLKAAYLEADKPSRRLLGLAMIGRIREKAVSLPTPPPDILWLLADILQEKALPLLTEAANSAVTNGNLDTFVSALLERARITGCSGDLIHAAIIADITGHHFARSRKFLSASGGKSLCRALEEIAELCTSDTPPTINILKSLGFSEHHGRNSAINALKRISGFLQCSFTIP